MNRIVFLFTFLLTATALYAQQTVKVNYNVTNPTPLAAGVTQNKMLLVSARHVKRADLVIPGNDGKVLEQRRFDRQKDAIEVDY